MKKINIENVIKQKTAAGRKHKDVDLKAFSTLTEHDRIRMIHEYPHLFVKKYRDILNTMLEEAQDGLKKQASFDAIKSANASGISDVTAKAGIRRAAITSGNIEDIYEYGDNSWIDCIIDLERALKLYVKIIDSYETGISLVLDLRMEGVKLPDIADMLGYGINTVSHYIYMSKILLDDKYEEMSAFLEASKKAKKKMAK